MTSLVTGSRLVDVQRTCVRDDRGHVPVAACPSALRVSGTRTLRGNDHSSGRFREEFGRNLHPVIELALVSASGAVIPDAGGHHPRRGVNRMFSVRYRG